MVSQVRLGLPPWRTSLWIWLPVSIAMVLFVAWVRLSLFRDYLVPLAYGLPLLACLVNRRRSLLYGMSILFTALSVVKVYWVMPAQTMPPAYDVLSLIMMLFSIWAQAIVIDVLIRSSGRLEAHARELRLANTELGRLNQALAIREAEVVRQNEELTAQGEELQQQNEELQQQSEELQQQAEELQVVSEDLRSANDLLRRREQGLESLVECARHLATDLREEKTMRSLCRAVVDLVGLPAVASAVLEKQGSSLQMRGHYGFDPGARVALPVENTLAAIVMRTGRTAGLPDVSLRPDILVAGPQTGEGFGALLAAPLRINGRAVGVLEVYASSPHEWSAASFQIIEWFASQAALVLEAVELHTELDRRRSEATESSIRKTRFLAAVSHDVRTPVNAISLMAEVISRTASEPDFPTRAPEMAAELKSSARALADLVTDVLDVARFDSGQFEIQSGQFYLQDVIATEVRQLRPLAHAKGLDLQVQLPDEPVVLVTDRIKLARVLVNLVGNAIKFTDVGFIRVEAAPTAAGGLDLSVTDTGVGIPSTHLPHIFDEFFQLRNPERDRSKGTGLGLAICKRLATALGCTINVTSTLGAGSRFVVHLPPSLCSPREDAVSVALQSPPANHVRRNGSLAGRSILLVEDHHTTRRATAHLLASEGAVVLTAENGRDALGLLAHESPDVLLLDLMLPDMDGTEILRTLQGARKDSLRHIFAVSGDVTPARQQQVRELGADALVAKPISIDELIATLAHAAKKDVQTTH